jgi:cytochrome c oxidase subunit 2
VTVVHEDSPRPRRRFRAGRLAGLGVLALLLTGCNGAVWERGGWPSPVTKQGHHVLPLYQGALLTALIIGAIVLGIMLWACIFHRKRAGDNTIPRQVRYNLPIEAVYTIVPIIIVLVLFYFTATIESNENKLSKPDMTVNVVGFQWAWQFNYPQQGLTVTGRPGHYPQLVLPVDEKIRFVERSPDVVHSFWVIPFLFKRDVVPGLPNQFQVTVNKKGTYRGKCTELCGTYHDRMLFTVKSVSPAAFASFMQRAKAQARHGSPMFSLTGPAQITNTEKNPAGTGRNYQSAAGEGRIDQ